MDSAQRTILCRHWGRLLAQLCAGLLVRPFLCEAMGVYWSEEGSLSLGSGTGCSCTPAVECSCLKVVRVVMTL